MYTWPLGLRAEYAGQFVTRYGQFGAASILMAVPAMILFLYSSKWLVSGLTLGGFNG